MRRFPDTRTRSRLCLSLATASLVLGGCAAHQPAPAPVPEAPPPVVHYVYNCKSDERSYDGAGQRRGSGEFSMRFAEDGSVRERHILYHSLGFADGIMNRISPEPRPEIDTPLSARLTLDDYGDARGKNWSDWDASGISFDAKIDPPANVPRGFSEVQAVYVPGSTAHIRRDGDHLYFDYAGTQGMTGAPYYRHRGIGSVNVIVVPQQAEAWAETSDVVGIYETVLTKRSLRHADKGKQPERLVLAYFQFRPKALLALIDQLLTAEDKWEKEEIGDFRQNKSCMKDDDPNDYSDREIIVTNASVRRNGA